MREYPGDFDEFVDPPHGRAGAEPSTPRLRKPNGHAEHSDDDRPTIKLRAGRLHEIATEAEQALLLAGAPIYVRHNGLVRPVVDTVEAAKGRTTKIARLAPVTCDTLIDHFSRSAYWLKHLRTKKRDAPADPLLRSRRSFFHAMASGASLP